MGVSDSLTHIFLWATLVVNAALFVLLIVLSIKHIQTSVFQFLSAAAVTAGCFFALQHNAAFTLNATLFAQGILLVCHCALLLYKALKEIWTPSAFAQHRKMKNSNTKAVNNAELNADTALSLIGRDIMELSSDAIYVHSNIAYLLERLNDIVMQKTEADGSAVLLVHDFEDKVTVKTVAGEFPPPYELPENIPHKQAVVAVHFKNVEFPFENNIFGDIIKSGKGELISSPQKPHIPKRSGRFFTSKLVHFCSHESTRHYSRHYRACPQKKLKGVYYGTLGNCKNSFRLCKHCRKKYVHFPRNKRTHRVNARNGNYG